MIRTEHLPAFPEQEALPGFRLYRVRPSQPDDHPALTDGAITASLHITITRLIDRAVMVLPACHPWADTDLWAGERWRRAERELAEMRRTRQ